MKYLLQFEFQKDKKSKYWFPVFFDVDTQEVAEEKGKEIISLLKENFEKVNNYSIDVFKEDITSNKILENYIKEERNGEFALLTTNSGIQIEDVDSNADRDVKFDESFVLKNYSKENISYLDFNKKIILTRNLSDNIYKFDEYLIIKLKQKAGFIKMDPKKNPKANLERLRGTFTLAGMVIALSLVYVLINWRTNVHATEIEQGTIEEIEDEIIPITEQNTPPPPPPPPPAAPEVIEIVEDEVEVEDVEMADTEADAETVVEVFEQEEEVVEEEVFTIVESMPEFPGGQKKLFEYLGKNVKFPPAAKANGISGKVYVNFTVGKDGKIRDIKILRGVHDLLDKEAVRVVKEMPSWKPGKQRGKTVSVSYNLPINFILK